MSTPLAGYAIWAEKTRSAWPNCGRYTTTDNWNRSAANAALMTLGVIVDLALMIACAATYANSHVHGWGKAWELWLILPVGIPFLLFEIIGIITLTASDNEHFQFKSWQTGPFAFPDYMAGLWALPPCWILTPIVRLLLSRGQDVRNRHWRDDHPMRTQILQAEATIARLVQLPRTKEVVETLEVANSLLDKARNFSTHVKEDEARVTALTEVATLEHLRDEIDATYNAHKELMAHHDEQLDSMFGKYRNALPRPRSLNR